MNTAEFEKLFFIKRLNYFENKKNLNKTDIEELLYLQLLYNIETYKETKKALQEIKVGKRIEKLLKPFNTTPLVLNEEEFDIKAEFNPKEIELNTFLSSIEKQFKNIPKKKCSTKLLKLVKNYANYIQKSSNYETAYVFLFRDMMLPYYYIKNKFSNKNIYPFLFGRKVLKYFYNNQSNDNFDFDYSDDEEIYLKFLYTTFDAVSLHPDNFDDFFNYLKPKYLKIINSNKPFKNFLKKYLSNIKSEKIIVVESGRFGTLPLILMCIDDRVDFRLLTTTPEMYGVFKNKFYTKDFRKMLLLEYSISQNEMIIFSSIKNNKIYIKQNKDNLVLQKSIDEISYITL